MAGPTTGVLSEVRSNVIASLFLAQGGAPALCAHPDARASGMRRVFRATPPTFARRLADQCTFLNRVLFCFVVVFPSRYRFYFQEYQPAKHVIVKPRAVWAIGAFIGEYDVPQCTPGTAVKDCKHEIWGVAQIGKGSGGETLHIAAAHFHCHAPTCLAMEIWNNKTGELVCRQEPVYGGTGKIAEHKYDEAGYIATPPCLWGEGQGLAPMPLVHGLRHRFGLYHRLYHASTTNQKIKETQNAGR